MATFGTHQISESDNQDKSDSVRRIILRSNMGPLDNGTRLTVCPSGVCASSISPKDQAADITSTNNNRCKRRRGTSWYSHLTPEHREAYLQRNREYKKRRKSHVAVRSNTHDKTDWTSCCNAQKKASQIDCNSDDLFSQHIHGEVQEHIVSESEDAIYMPMDIFPANQGNFNTR